MLSLCLLEVHLRKVLALSLLPQPVLLELDLGGQGQVRCAWHPARSSPLANAVVVGAIAGSELQETTPPFQSAAAGSLPTSDNHRQNPVLTPPPLPFTFDIRPPANGLFGKPLDSHAPAPTLLYTAHAATAPTTSIAVKFVRSKAFKYPNERLWVNFYIRLRTGRVYCVQNGSKRQRSSGFTTFASSSSRNFWVCFVLKRFAYKFSNSRPRLKC